MSFNSPIKAHVANLGNTFVGGPGINTQHGIIFNHLPFVKQQPIIPLTNPPIASAGISGAANPNQSSSLSASGEVDPEKLDEDVDKIKNIEKEIKKKEEEQKAQEENLKKQQEELDKAKEEAKKITNEQEKKKKLEEIETKQKKLDEEKAKLETEKKATADQRKEYETKIAPTFAQKDDKGAIIKDEKGNIKFLEKEQIEKVKQLIRIKDPATIDQARKALEYFNQYRKAYPAEVKGLETFDPSNDRLQRQASMSPIKQGTNALNTLGFEEEAELV